MIERSSPNLRRFQKNALFACVGNFSTTFALAVIIISIARLTDQESVGRFSYAAALCAPLFLLASLRLRDISATAGDNYSVHVYFLVSLSTNTAAILAILPIGYVLGVDAGTLMLAFFIGIWKLTKAFSEVVYGNHQRNTQMPMIARLQIIHCIATVLCFTSTLWMFGNLALSVALLCPLNIWILLSYDLPSIDYAPFKRFKTENLSDDRLRKLAFSIAITTVPLGVGAAIFSLNMLIPRMLLEQYFSLKAVGLFATLAMCARLGTPVMQAVGQTASSGLARSVRQLSSNDFLKFVGLSAAVSLVIGVVLTSLGWCFGPALLTIVYGPEYQVSAASVALMMIYAALVYASTLLTYGLIAARRLKSQLTILCLTVATVGILGVLLIPEYGLWGACVSLVASSLVRLAGTLVVIKLITGELVGKSEFLLNHPDNISWKATCDP